MPTNEPELWTDGNGNYFHECVGYYTIPLYTHPAKEQDESFDRTASHMADKYVSYKPKLTDEEIHDLMDEIRQAVGDDIERAMYRMAKAILRKAQEK